MTLTPLSHWEKLRLYLALKLVGGSLLIRCVEKLTGRVGDELIKYLEKKGK